MKLPQAMGSGPLARSLFYQYRCTLTQADRLQASGSWQSQDTKAKPIPALAEQPATLQIQHPGSSERPRSRAQQDLQSGPLDSSLPRRITTGTAAAGMPFRLYPHHGRSAEGGGGCLTSATAQPWQVQDGRR